MDNNNYNNNVRFMELYETLSSIINSFPKKDDISFFDNVIIIFINSNDIRFNSVDHCLNIIDEINKNNVSLILLTFDKNIEKSKVDNISSFPEGLAEGYFFQVNDYYQIKQIFINLANDKHQANFIGFDYSSFDRYI